jgi:nucleoside phosphorylase
MPSKRDGQKQRQFSRAAILTAIPVEHEAVCRHLTDLEEEKHREGTIYQRGLFLGQKRSWQVDVVEVGPGNNRAAVEAERAINHFKPSIVLFVDVVGGLKDVAIGDVAACKESA